MKDENDIIHNLDRSITPISKPDVGLAGFQPSLFENLDMEGKKFVNNNLTGAIFSNCNLRKTDFTQDNTLAGTSFIDSDIEGANFEGTNVEPYQFILAINAEKASFDHKDKFIKRLEKERQKATKQQDSGFFYRLYRGFIRLLGGNIKWQTPPTTHYDIPEKIDISDVMNLIPSSEVKSPKSHPEIKKTPDGM